ncbi:ribonucleoside-diphosphate reductase subunit alpha [uncultured Salinisphaera sp.]|uniref:ribonucleoside-diphosphate reductase subunit alpha n=1 Tax=uncultured Salinisphaera sp. TaxID=359372 RepID=UPI0032B19DCE|tara:strand:+ start:10746 stop:13772 length:3027 start_codon:yes stop_codon:yes gene_type:complete
MADTQVSERAEHVSHTSGEPSQGASLAATQPGSHKVIRRNGKVTPFDASKIELAVTKAFIDVEGQQGAASSRIRQTVKNITEQVVQGVTRSLPGGGAVHIEDIQDYVELALMRSGEHKVARSYVLYREERAHERAAKTAEGGQDVAAAPASDIQVSFKNGTTAELDRDRLQRVIAEACEGIDGVNAQTVFDDTLKNAYDGITEDELSTALILSARQRLEAEPNYGATAARLLMDKLRHEALTFLADGQVEYATHAEMREQYATYFANYIHRAVHHELLDPRLAEYDLEQLGNALIADRDLEFTYLGLQTLYDRYFIHHEATRFELPQAFYMRVAMGLAINEIEREEKAIEFYKLLSSFDFMSSTPTLFNSGTLRPQLSSCYLTSVDDDLHGIYEAVQDNALLSKFAGGLGNDWTPVRAMGAHIKGTNGKSQGVVPFLKVVNDTAVAVNQGGKRKGAVCAYLESWHKDIEEFLDLRKNTGDDRRRCHDMNTANWIPDLFVKRVLNDEPWTLFSPNDVPELHDLTGRAFQEAYEAYERKAERGEITNYKTIQAVTLWRKMLSMLFETGHPWFTFKDPCNLRSPQQHKGVVHSSNLCTEITLNTEPGKEIAVCNLGSINLPQHIENGVLNTDKLQATINTAMRMLDNVIEYNYYSVKTARDSNLRHRPVGMGLMGFQDALYKLKLPYESDQAVEFADRSMEQISYYAIQASTNLAEERGAYSTFQGSLWDQGVLPIDSIKLLRENRGAEYLEQDESQTLDWETLRARVKSVGMRNSNCMAIAPTATIANITGVSQSIEPTYQNLYVKSNLSGEFTVVNPYLVDDLKERGLWDQVMANDLKYYDGSVQAIDRIPDELKVLYKCAFEIDPRWLVESGSRRQKWLDQAQSLNLYMAEPSGRKLDELYKFAWKKGLKTTYYLRTMGATHTEKSTISDHRLNAVANGGKGSGGGHVAGGSNGGSPAAGSNGGATNGQTANGASAAPAASAKSPAPAAAPVAPMACAIDDPDCEACQ